MADPLPFPVPDTDTQAAAWFVRRLNAPGDVQQEAAFRHWREACPGHAAAYAAIERIWATSALLPAKPAVASSRRRLLRGAVAAGVAGLAGGTGLLMLPAHPLAQWRTARGETRRLALPDASVAEMSADTALDTAFSLAERRLRLLGGEAFFQVAADASRPFVVEAAGGGTTALGGAFGVACGEDGARVVVTDGAVEVRAGGGTVQVGAGQCLRYRAEGPLGRPGAANLAQDLAWRQGRLVFHARPLGQVAQALRHWGAGTVLVMDGALAARPVTVMLDTTRPDQLLDSLLRGLPVRAVSLPARVTLLYPA
jgi:transmembrane sensor